MIDFINIINKVAGKKVLPHTKYLLLKAFSSQAEATYHIMCSHCGFYGYNFCINEPRQQMYTCRQSNCGKPNFLERPKVLYVTFKVEPLIKKLLNKHKDNLLFHEQCQPQFPSVDVFSGKVYNEIVDKNGPFIAVGTNSDGVNRYTCSKEALWPQFLITYNLPASIRNKQENILITALFSGRHIDMGDFYEEFVTEISLINRSGGIQLDGKRYPMFCINAALDSTARPKLQNHTQFNGRFGCSFCYTEGVSIDGSMKYPSR
jgi:hypothetical protein